MTLNENNYAGWKYQIRLALQAKNLWHFVLDSSLRNDPRAKFASTLITSTLSYDNLLKVINHEFPYDIWTALENIFENRSYSEKQILLSKFHGYRITSVRDLSKSLGEIQAMAARLKSLGAPMDDDTIMSIILNGLRDSFKLFKISWNLSSSSQKNLNKLISHILAEAATMKHPTERALIAQKVPENRKFNKPYNKSGQQSRNNYPKKPGYRQNQQKQGKPQNDNKNRKNDTCNFCKQKGHWARDCLELKNKKKVEERGPVALMAITGDIEISEMTWIADSGCSAHMTPHKEWILDYRRLPEPVKVRVGNNQLITARGIGSIETSVGTLKNVHYVPDLGQSLFSLSSAAEQGIEFKIDQESLKILQGQEVIMTASKVNGVYLLEFEIIRELTALVAATMDDWHQRLGHPSTDVIERMARKSSVEGMKLKNSVKHSKCEACALNKCTRTSHPSKSTEKAKKAGQVLHIDTAGPMAHESLGGSRYFLLAKDEFSTYKQVRPVASKSDISDEVKRIISVTELETGNKVLCLVSDNGSEFTNHDLSSYLRDKGIEQRFSVVYTPQQNGFIEREIRTVTECARTLLNNAQLPQPLWAEMVSTAVYLLNRRINSRTGNKTPFELWFGKKPSVKNLHRVGTKAVILSRENGRTKFDAKGDKMIFIGYTDVFNTYRFYDPEMEQIIVRCDAVFLNETRPTVSRTDEPENVTEIELIKQDARSSDSSETDCGEGMYETAEESSDDSDATIEDPGAESASAEEKSEAGPERFGTFIQNVPKNLIYRNRPPVILESRLRPRKAKHQANLSTIEAAEDPSSYKEAMKRSDKGKWLEAMKDEINSLKKNEVWILVDRPRCNIVTNKWVLKIKRKPDGSIERYRARLVARGFSQIQGID
jgi:hypothetical protein